MLYAALTPGPHGVHCIVQRCCKCHQALSSEVTSQGLHALILHLRVDPYTVASIVLPGSCHMLVLSTIHTRVHAYLMDAYIWESI